MKEALKQSIDNLRTNKLRSCLTMFGIMWGVISIVILSAMGEGFQRGNQAVLEELGKNIVVIRNGRTSVQAGGERAGRVIRLNIGDVHELRSKSRLIEHLSPELMRGGVSIKSAYNAASLQISGIWPDFQSIRTIEVSHGRLINEADNDEARRVVVIGREAAMQLFADRNPIGEPVKLNGLDVHGHRKDPAEVSGFELQRPRRASPVRALRGDAARFSADRADTTRPIPFPSSSRRRTRGSPTRFAKSSTRSEHASVFGVFGQTMVEREIRRVLAPVKGFDPDDREALSLWNTAIESVMFSKMMQSMKNFFLGVSLITLVLGGIGVMNIMLIAVRERTREIGLRKALGATSHSIHRQFIVEGLALTLLSGALGLAARLGTVPADQHAADAGALLRNDHHARHRRDRGRRAGGRRPAGGALSGFARRGAAAGRVAAVRGLTCGSIAKSSARPSARSLAHRFRAALTMLGISWGIVTVVLLMAYGTGFQRAIMYGFRNAFSQGTVLVGSGQTSMQAGGERSGRRIMLKQDDVDAMSELGSIKFVSPEYMQSVPISYGLRQTTAGVRGVAPEYGIMRTRNGRVRAISQPRRRREPPAGRVSRLRGRAPALQQHPAGR